MDSAAPIAVVILIEIVITGLDPVIHLLRKGVLRRFMDCRVKPGNDSLRAVASDDGSDSLFKRVIANSHAFAISQHVFCSRFALTSALSKQRAQGMPGARCAR
jgi:hypothetical protein